MSQHTSGPWFTEEAVDEIIIRTEVGVQFAIAMVFGDGSVMDAAKAANARLIAAAPELLEALKNRLCGSCDGSGIAYTLPDETEFGCPPGSSGVPCPECSASRAAIAKAES